MFYTLDQTKAALGKTEDDIRQLAREGRLRAFRDGPRLRFRAEQVDQLAQQMREVGVAQQIRPASGSVADEPPRIPRALRYRREGGTITMTWPWLDLLSAWPLLGGAVFGAPLWWIVRSPRGIGETLRRSDPLALWFLPFFVVIGFVLTYIGVAHVINWTRITLDAETLHVRHRPLCWPTWGIALARRDIRKVAVERASFGGGDLGSGGGDERCRLYAELATGKVRRLSPWLKGGKRLEFIAAQINQWRSKKEGGR